MLKQTTKSAPNTNGHGQLPPQDKKAERCLLGGLLIDQAAITIVAPLVKPEDFYLDANGAIFRAMLGLVARSEPVDIVTVMAELRRQGKADVGDGQDRAEVYLMGLLTEVPTSSHARAYALTIAETAQRRRIITTAGQMATAAWNEQEDLATVLEQAQGILFDAAKGRNKRQLQHIGAGMSDYMAEMERRFANPVKVTGIPTGYVDLDRMMNGLKPQELIIVAGRPSMGKTGLLLGMAINMSVKGKMNGAVFSLEMSRGQLRDRMIANLVNCDVQRLTRGDLDLKEREAFYRATAEVTEAPLYINDLPGLTVMEMMADARRVASQIGLDYIMVDFLQLIHVPGSHKQYESVTEAARGLQWLAKDIDVPVIAASQLNRTLESRSDKRPGLSDLRDSGAIEEAADAVLALYRDDYYEKDKSAMPNQGELIITKQRNGPTGTVGLYWRPHTASYHNLSRREVVL